MGFPNIWIKLIMRCITTVTYQVIVDGELTNTFLPQQAIKQGDPLSPNLFILGANVLSNMLQQAELNNQIQGVRACRNAPRINHLMFVDDLILFFKVSDHSCQVMNSILSEFQTLSRLRVNKEK